MFLVTCSMMSKCFRRPSAMALPHLSQGTCSSSLTRSTGVPFSWPHSGHSISISSSNITLPRLRADTNTSEIGDQCLGAYSNGATIPPRPAHHHPDHCHSGEPVSTSPATFQAGLWHRDLAVWLICASVLILSVWLVLIGSAYGWMTPARSLRTTGPEGSQLETRRGTPGRSREVRC